MEEELGPVPEDLLEAATLAYEMGLPVVDPVLMEARLDELRERAKREKDEVNALQLELERGQKELASMEVFGQQLEELLAMPRSSPDPAMLHQMQRKQEEYKARLAKNPPSSNTPLVPLEKRLAQLETVKAELVRVESELAAFHWLPADLSLARIEVARAEHELHALLQERDRLLRTAQK